ncbi:hypothetical protein [Variovorax sp. PBL-H6]|nr:hypothetical protein [Variovorax sp. PBL-H6]
MTIRQLDRLLTAGSVAVFGASSRRMASVALTAFADAHSPVASLPQPFGI